MARISRLVVPKYPHPITQRGVRSMAIFQTGEDRRAYLQFWAEEAERFGVEILVRCLLTNPVHFIAVSQNGDSLARAFGEAHRRYTRRRFGGIFSRVASVPVFWMRGIYWRRQPMWN